MLTQRVAAAPMSVMEALRHRRAVRSYTDRAVDKAAIRELLDAAVHAPTAMHEEPWAFVVIQDKITLKRLSDSAKQFLGEMERTIHVHDRPMAAHFTPPDNIFYDAGTLIVIYGRPTSPFVVADCWLAAENILLAATRRISSRRRRLTWGRAPMALASRPPLPVLRRRSLHCREMSRTAFPRPRPSSLRFHPA